MRWKNLDTFSNSKFSLAAIFFVILSLSACREDPELIPTTLEITVLDESGAPVQGAEVTLFLSLDDWLLETNQAASSEQSDSEGIAVFANIDTGTYYIDIKKGTLNNWEGGARKSVFQNLINSTNIEIKVSNSGLLSSASGKEWILSGFIRNNQDIYDFLDDCEKDTERTFFKGPTLGSVSLFPGELKCEENEPDREDGFWEFSEDQKNLDIRLAFETLRWTIEELTETTLVYNYIDPNTGFFIEETYTAK